MELGVTEWGAGAMAKQVRQRCLRRGVLERTRSVQGRLQVHQGPLVMERQALQEKDRWLLGDDSPGEVFTSTCDGPGSINLSLPRSCESISAGPGYGLRPS